jgi:hypothetical protein
MRRGPHLLREIRAGLDLLVRAARDVYHAPRAPPRAADALP